MKETPIIKFISITLCVALCFLELLYLAFFSLRKGIKKEEIINLINNIEVEKVVTDISKINDININVDKEIIDRIFKTETFNKYVKEKTVNTYLAMFYNEKLEPITKIEIINIINISMSEVENFEITEEVKNEILAKAEIIGEKLENTNIVYENNVNAILLNETNILFLSMILVIFVIIILNRSENALKWIGIPTLTSGLIWILIFLSLTNKLSYFEIDIEIYTLLNNYLKGLLKTIKILGISFLSIGIIEILAYFILKNREYKNGESKLI